ncbi:MAG: pyrroline-5-carboxylate reductase [Gammaproteobacteria bacterium]
MEHPNIAFIGAGNLGTSLIAGLIKDEYPVDKIWVADPTQERVDYMKEAFGVHACLDNAEVMQHAKVVVFCIKPQHFKTAAEQVSESVQTNNALVISVAAGIRIEDISKWLNGHDNIVRTMPNTPALIGCGAIGMVAERRVTEAQRNLAESILRAVGLTVWFDDEEKLDVVTALSGSGPAYFFYVIESLQNAAIKLGLPEKEAKLLALQTAFGAGRMALESEEDISTLRKNVTSPGGTTEQALKVLDEKNMRDIWEKAMEAAAQRSRELADSFGA